MLQEISDWLSHSQLNAIFSDTTRLETWLIIPLSQSLHILGIGILMIAIAMLNLQLLGFRVTRFSFAENSARWMPWIWTALAILLGTGLVQIIAEPTREIMNYTFRIKMIMLAIVLALTVTYRRQVKKDPNYWSGERRNLALSLASLSLVLWLGIIATGRLVAYVGGIETF